MCVLLTKDERERDVKWKWYEAWRGAREQHSFRGEAKGQLSLLAELPFPLTLI